MDTSLKSLSETLTASGFEPDEASKETGSSLRKRIGQLSMSMEIDDLQERLERPVKKFDERPIGLFCEAVRQVILDGDPEAQTSYLRAVISTSQ